MASSPPVQSTSFISTPIQSTPVTSQSYSNKQIVKRISKLENTMTKIVAALESFDKRMNSLEHSVLVLTTKFELHAHKSDPTSHTNPIGFGSTANWTSKPEYQNRHLPKIKQVQQQASKTLATSSSSSASSSSSLTGSSVSDITKMQY